jgi:hypothetical protein
MPTTRRRSPTQLGQIGRRHQNIKDVQNTVSQARAMVGQMKQEREKITLLTLLLLVVLEEDQHHSLLDDVKHMLIN